MDAEIPYELLAGYRRSLCFQLEEQSRKLAELCKDETLPQVFENQLAAFKKTVESLEVASRLIAEAERGNKLKVVVAADYPI